MRKNIVLIETVDTIGTGILYPCKYEEKELGNFQSFIIFTNRHVLSEIGMMEDPKKDIKEFIILQIYDDNGNRLKDTDIKKVLVHNISSGGYNYDDVAALLVCIDPYIPLSVEKHIYEEELKNRDILFMEGYPGVMLDDEVSQRVQLQGMAKDVFPHNTKIGVYQIKDDYHWYNNMYDLRLMEGFSGGPVYIEKNQGKYLVGMNQSVANIADGENPFKLVYYLKIKHIVERLRETGCILFRKERDDSYRLVWVYGSGDKIQEWKAGPALLLIGGSGAGKSSFAKDFAYHGDKLQVTNDGQTTRTNIMYQYSIFCDNPKVSVKLLNKEKFKKHLYKLNGLKPIVYCFRKIFDLSKDKNGNDELFYLRNCYYLIEHIALHRKRNILDQIEEVLMIQARNAYFLEAAQKAYENAMEIIFDSVPVEQVKFICDRPKLEKIKTEYIEQISYNTQFNRGSGLNEEEKKKILKKIIEENWKNGCINHVYLIDVIYKYCSNQIENYKRYQNIYFSELQNENKTDNMNMFLQNREWFLGNENMRSFKEGLFDCLFEIEGFFHLSEFNFMLSADQIKEEICTNATFIVFEWKEQKESKIKKDIEIEECIEEIYGNVYDKIKEALIKYGLIEKHGEMAFENPFLNMEKAEQEILTYCLQVKQGKSLTGIIQSVKIEDRISNGYALLMDELKIKSIRILDTCGLDHIEKNENMEGTLQDVIENYEASENVKFEDFNILYIKKLDSGRPDELRQILPIVYRVIPQAPIYCVFTGIDIFYHGNTEAVRQIYWNEKNIDNCPKAVQYILLHKELIGTIECSEERKNNLYLVLKNNLIPYCGRSDLLKADYNYYENNLSYIRKLLVSIIRKEYSSLGIVDIDMVKSVMNEYSGSAEKLIEKVFERASVYCWSFHHMTEKANVRYITKKGNKKELGFSRTFRHQWNQLFYDAYIAVVTKENREFIEQFDSGRDAIEAALVNMTTSFLGTGRNLHDGSILDQDKNPFRKALEKMYEKKKDGTEEYIYKYNPFTNKINGSDEEVNGNEMEKNRKEYLNDVVDFAKGFKLNRSSREDFVDFFKREFLEQLKKDNADKEETLVEINYSVVQALSQLEDEFVSKYHKEDNGIAARRMFNKIMEHYFAKKK